MCAQSSAAVMAITLILCSSGVLDLYLGIALVMGENIGTTVTSNIAALTANTQARRAALAHFIFNIFGVVWILCIFHPFVDMVSGMINRLFPGVSPEVAITYKLSAFHTAFNQHAQYCTQYIGGIGGYNFKKSCCIFVLPCNNTACGTYNGIFQEYNEKA